MKFTIKIQPTNILYKVGDRRKLKGNSMREAQRLWQAANFRVEMGGLPCKMVTKVGAFTWTMGAAKDRARSRRGVAKTPGGLEFPNLTFYLPEDDVRPWQDWHNEFVIDGKCAESRELSGSITFMSPDFKKELGTIALENVCPSSPRVQRWRNKRTPRRFTVGLSVQKVRFARPEQGRTRRR